ncbi:hypothetical protein [Desulfoscipio gibsoniae]
MKNKKIAKVVVTGMLIAGLATSYGGPVLAGDNSSTRNSGAASIAAGKTMVHNIINRDADQSVLKEALADLVIAGTITQDQSDAVLTYFQQNLPQKPVLDTVKPADGVNKFEQGPVLKIVDPMRDLVDNGTITGDQAQSIGDKMSDITDRQRQQQWQTSLDTLVSEGTITQDQTDNILTFLEANAQKMKDMKQDMLDQTKDMDKEQITQYFKEHMGDIKDPVSQMVDQGIINRQQADAVRGAVTVLSGTVINDGSPDSGLSGGQDVFFSISGDVSDDNQD